MGAGGWRRVALAAAWLLAGSACAAAAGGEATLTSPPPPTPDPPPPPRVVHEQPYTPFAVAGGALTLRHPAARVERVGFHEANHDGARAMEAVGGAAAPATLEGRNRGTDPHTAADVVVDPEAEIRSPVSGRVLRGGGYILYCRIADDYVVIEPDERRGWEVKVLHIDGLQVRPGDRVVAGETVLAPKATQLPFASQVDELRTAEPAWPHVHIEVVDPTIPDKPNPGGGGC